MSRHLAQAAAILTLLSWHGSMPLAQQSSAPSPRPALPPEKAISLAEQGRCAESISALKHAMAGTVPADVRKQAGVLGVRCSLAMDDRDSTNEFIRLLSKQFRSDPDVLFVIVHAYSDLSSRAAMDLGREAPQSIAAHKLNAEALEMQGKWEPAQHEYELILQKDPNARGIHFLLGRLLLSRPDAGADAAERARQEFLKEIAIDPANAGAHYILGELSRRDEKCEDALPQFSEAVKYNPSFAEAYLGQGLCLVSQKKYEEAVPPLRTAARLTPGNPEIHHALATALQRSGHPEEAQKEFAIQSSLMSGQGSQSPQ
ncbi:tetratricopeptide repeat protein [Occallatibacter riparius]|uniref:Tetratricopeptide repeat protein n=1 Tax=Occallatibacter riparius TaxID=1002689 RepID=A0A9J7BPM7_9BACT|nr:tetratricopeptide repeat protein [Occallatibacter riparius]UWZ83698.1 tetratricopeptide repeat protein [Occallatibacter riparius]